MCICGLSINENEFQLKKWSKYPMAEIWFTRVKSKSQQPGCHWVNRPRLVKAFHCVQTQKGFSLQPWKTLIFHRTLVVFSDSDMSKKITGVHEINDSSNSFVCFCFSALLLMGRHTEVGVWTEVRTEGLKLCAVCSQNSGYFKILVLDFGRKKWWH